jgi:hypothetical protein
MTGPGSLRGRKSQSNRHPFGRFEQNTYKTIDETFEQLSKRRSS